MLVFVLILAVLFVVTLWSSLRNSGWVYRNDLEGAFGVVSFFTGIVLLTCIIVWAIAPVSWRSDIAEFESVKTSIQNARAQDLSELERVSIQDKIIEHNKWLAGAQYRDKHYWIECIPGEIQDVKPIE